MAIVRLPRALLKKLPFLYLLPLRGREPHFRLGSPPIIWLHFLFPLPMSGDPRSLRCEHLRDPHSLLTVTFWLLDNVSSTGGEYHSHLLVSVSHHVTQPTHKCSVFLMQSSLQQKNATLKIQVEIGVNWTCQLGKCPLEIRHKKDQNSCKYSKKNKKKPSKELTCRLEIFCFINSVNEGNSHKNNEKNCSQRRWLECFRQSQDEGGLGFQSTLQILNLFTTNCWQTFFCLWVT